MIRLVLRRGTVAEAAPPAGAEQRLVVDVPGRGPRPAIADVGLVGAAHPGDDVVVNTQAADLGLGSGGFDVVHANLTRGLGGEGVPGAHVMKLNYSSLQHAVLPVEGPQLDVPLRRPAAVISVHGQLAPLVWAAARARPGVRLGFVQTAGGALPGGHSRVVADLRSRALLAGFLTAGPAYGGEREAISAAGAVHHGLRDLGWDAAVCGPGPGILGSGSVLGHGGLVALDSAHTALALGCEVVLCARMSSGDPRPRHHGLSHHAHTVLELLLAPVTVAVPPGHAGDVPPGPGHEVLELDADADVEGYAAAGLPVRTMGRGLDEDRLFFAAALAAGQTLAAKIARHER
ncbi:MAG TPA: DUF3866 family protein [Solirubrobacteraceae bacterium]|nr:DUF3866 family protein [Solirubrobacteraceae bacterium]